MPYCKPRVLGILSDTKLTCKRGSGAHLHAPQASTAGEGKPGHSMGPDTKRQAGCAQRPKREGKAFSK